VKRPSVFRERRKAGKAMARGNRGARAKGAHEKRTGKIDLAESQGVVEKDSGWVRARTEREQGIGVQKKLAKLR